MITPIYTLVSWDTGIQLRWGSAGCRTWVTGRMNWSKIRSEITRPAKADAIGHALGSGSMSAFKAIMFADPDPFLLSLLLLLLLLCFSFSFLRSCLSFFDFMMMLLLLLLLLLFLLLLFLLLLLLLQLLTEEERNRGMRNVKGSPII